MTQTDSVNKQLKDFFKRMNYTQSMIAEKLGSSKQVVQALLKDRAFGKKTANRWSEVFGFNPAWLITGEGKMFLADKEKELLPFAKEIPTTDIASQQTTMAVVNDFSQIVANEILKLVTTGQLYPKATIQEKELLIKEKDAEIQRLNREIGKLQAQLEQAGIEPAIKKHA